MGTWGLKGGNCCQLGLSRAMGIQDIGFFSLPVCLPGFLPPCLIYLFNVGLICTGALICNRHIVGAQ